MKHTPRLLTTLLLTVAASAAFAQSTASTVQRDVNQQTRIEQGLKSGSLTTQEAGRLEREESHVDRLQAKTLRDGSVTPAERQRLEQAQNRVSHDIQAAKTNGVTGAPGSASSERMQADVQRNINQEKRIEQGVQSGTVTNREAGRLEHAQARTDHREAAAARNGHVGAHEQARIQHQENRDSAQIAAQKHNKHHRKG